MRLNTVGQRVTFGFGVVMAFGAIVGGTAYFGIGHVVKKASEAIDSASLLGNFTQHEVDHLRWARRLTQMLTDDTVSTADVITDGTKCELGEWLNGPERRAVVREIPSLQPLLTELETDHLRMHSSAREVLGLYRAAHGSLFNDLGKHWLDFQSWSDEVGERLALEGGGLNAYKQMTRVAVEQTLSVIAACDNDPELTTLEAKQAAAIQIIKEIRYGPQGTDYFWINNFEPRMVMHPFKPQLDGKDLSEVTDPDGKLLFIDMVRECQGEEGGGFVMYQWPRPDADTPTPKISYVEQYEPWGWIVGTGVFLDEHNQTLMTRAAEVAAGQPFRFGVTVNPLDSRFRQYLDSEQIQTVTTADPDFKALIDACRKHHEAALQAAAQVQDFVTADQFAAAMELYRTGVLSEGEALHEAYLKAIAMEQALHEGQVAAAEAYATRTYPALQDVGRLLAAVRDEVQDNLTDGKAVLNAASVVRRRVYIVGTLGTLFGLLLLVLVTRSIVRALRHTIVGLNEGADQVQDATGSVSQASQSLAQFAGEQANSIDQARTSLEGIANASRSNADDAGEASRLTEEARSAAENGEHTVANLDEAMTAINDSSDKISKIIKVIEEIAFQTNLLSLNAAVEAARAGENGKGFAVVAEEVRNLARRAADAARETATLIGASVERARQGSQVANEVGSALGQIASAVQQASTLVNRIASGSEEQAKSIEEVRTSVTDIDGLTQSNAASAEECASASEELSSLSMALKDQLIADLAALVDGDKRRNRRKMFVTRSTVSTQRDGIGTECEVTTSDVSEGGIGLRSKKPLEIGAACTLRVPIGDNEWQTVRGRVVRCHQTPEGDYSVGVAADGLVDLVNKRPRLGSTQQLAPQIVMPAAMSDLEAADTELF